MKCPDCEMEVDKLVHNLRCKKCQVRYTNCKHRNIEYVPLVNIKGTTEYIRAMALRNGNKIKAKKTKTSKTNKTTNVIKHSSLAQDLVNKDIQDYIKNKNITICKNTLPLEVIFEWFYLMCQETNYINDLNDEKIMYDTLIVDYLHELKRPVNDPAQYAISGEKMAIIQSKRTPIDNELDKYKIIQDVINYIKSNKTLINMMSKARIELNDLLKKQENPYYLSDTTSLQQYDYVIKPDETKPITRNLVVHKHKQNLYKIKPFKAKNLYGNPNYSDFIYKETVSANSIQQAKESFIAYLKREFSNLIYNTTEIQVVLASEYDKECL